MTESPDYFYTDEELDYIRAAENRYTAKEVAAKLGRTWWGVYAQARRMEPPVQLKKEAQGSLELTGRGQVNFEVRALERVEYQSYIDAIAAYCNLSSKGAVGKKALFLAFRWIQENSDG